MPWLGNLIVDTKKRVAERLKEAHELAKGDVLLVVRIHTGFNLNQADSMLLNHRDES